MKAINHTESTFAIYLGVSLLITFIVMLLISSNYAITSSELKAKILFENESHDFGKVEQGIQLEYSFKFINEGAVPLFIKKVQPSCGCTGAVTDGENEYSEGESGTIKITFNTQGREGHQEKQVHVFSNDTENPDKVLTFSCDIVNGE